MRKINAWLCLLIFLLLLVHAIAGGFQLMGVIPGGSQTLTAAAWILVGFLAVHTVIGVKLTIDTLRAVRKSGVSYGRENLLFWARRISGLAILVLLVTHLLIFAADSGGVYRLHLFAGAQLVTQILLVLAVLVHILTNIRPLFIAFGAGRLRVVMKDILFILSVILLFCGAAFLIYYLRWNVLWK